MPRRKDAMLHASQAKEQVLEAFKLVRADYEEAVGDKHRVSERVNQLKKKHDELRNAALQLGISSDDLGDDGLDN